MDKYHRETFAAYYCSRSVYQAPCLYECEKLLLTSNRCQFKKKNYTAAAVEMKTFAKLLFDIPVICGKFFMRTKIIALHLVLSTNIWTLKVTMTVPSA